MTQVNLKNFNFNVTGLKLNYSINKTNYSLILDPLATCSLLHNAGLIEDFSTDTNGEPVILFTDKNENRGFGYGYELWCYFVKSFLFTNRIAEMLVEYREEKKATNKALGIIKYLLQPLKAA